MNTDFFQRPEYKASMEKFETCGPLGVIAEDYANIAIMPAPELVQNPGKTRADLMDDGQLLRYLMDLVRHILKFSSFSRDESEVCKKFVELSEKNLKVSFYYLKSIGRFPSSLSKVSTPEELVEKFRKSYDRGNTSGLQHRRSKGSGRGLR